MDTARAKWWLLLAGAVGLLTYALWRWMDPSSTPVETPSQARALSSPRKTPRRNQPPRLRQATPDKPRAPGATPAPTPTPDTRPIEPAAGEAAPTPGSEPEVRLEVTVVDDDGQPVQRAMVRSEDCQLSRRAPGGHLTVTVRADQCTLEGARMDGLLATWSDPVTVDLHGKEAASVVLEVPVEPTAGLGLQITRAEGGVAIRRVLPGTPAAEAGLEAGDVVLSVDGEETANLSLEEFVDLATGPAESEVDLVVRHTTPDGPEEVELTLVRHLLQDGSRREATPDQR